MYATAYRAYYVCSSLDRGTRGLEPVRRILEINYEKHKQKQTNKQTNKQTIRIQTMIELFFFNGRSPL